MINELLNIDCMEYMKDISDNYFDLAIVDPPYGINIGKMTMGKGSNMDKGLILRKSWDRNSPDQIYFDELIRISKNQIIWGANHFISKIPYDSSCWIVWDKKDYNSDFADGEMAWTSFKSVMKIFQRARGKGGDQRNKIHPTQKPIALYKWLLKNYAKPGWKLFDSHSGSGSFRIAAYDMGFDLISCEIDKDYCRDNEARFQNHIKQAELFDSKEIQELTFDRTND